MSIIESKSVETGQETESMIFYESARAIKNCFRQHLTTLLSNWNLINSNIIIL